MLEKYSLRAYAQAEQTQQKYEGIRKGDFVEVIWKLSKYRRQKTRGTCLKIRTGTSYPYITITYKIAGEKIQQVFPLKVSSLVHVGKV